MKLVFLGTGGYHPNERRETTCIMLPEVGITLDAGTGMYRAANYLATDTLDIFLSHAHLDHVVGITYLFNVLRGREMQHVRVHGEQEKLAAIDDHLLAESLFPAKPPIEYCPLAAEDVLPQGGRLTHFALQHPGGAVGYRLDWSGRSLGYVTDTTAASDAPYVDRIRDVDLLIHECYFPDGREEFARVTGHSCLTPVAQVARQANVKRLALMHVDPLNESDDPVSLNTAKAIFPETILAEDGLELDF